MAEHRSRETTTDLANWPSIRDYRILGCVLALAACGGSASKDSESRAGGSSNVGGGQGGAAPGGIAGGVTVPGGCMQGENCSAGGATASGGSQSPPPASGFLPCYGGCTDDLDARPVPQPRQDCPEEEPVVDSECIQPQQLCSYGESEQAACRRFYRCNATWQIDSRSTLVSCRMPPKGYCPPEPPHGSECEISSAGPDVPCSYTAFECYCEGYKWNCYGPPADPRCPVSLPNIGEGCDEQGVECAYAVNGCVAQPYSTVFCYQGSWEPGMELPCVG